MYKEYTFIDTVKFAVKYSSDGYKELTHVLIHLMLLFAHDLRTSCGG